MVTLEKEIETQSQSLEADVADGSSPGDTGESQRSRRLSHRHTIVDPDLLSPPVNTFRATRQSRTTRHRPTRSQSAPPERRTLAQENEGQPGVSEDSRQGSESLLVQVPPRRATTPSPSLSFGNSSSLSGRVGPGELVRPPPPLCKFLLFTSPNSLRLTQNRNLVRPTTFWRKTRRSGVTSASYSPSSYLIRRSTYIAAGLKFDKPIHDLSALCVESRVERVVCKATNEEWF